MSVMPIVTEPDPRLRQVSRELEVAEITTPEFQKYLDDLIETMNQADGVGIASPQVGKNIRAVVVSLPQGDECLINPEIIKFSEAKVQSEEGCLSVPGRYGIVERSKKVTVRALNRHGRKIEFEAKNMPAIIVQHEVDHINGILFIDKAIKLTKAVYSHI